MLKEISSPTDKQKRRWFSDDYFDLIVWIDRNEKISGFQLCYDKHKAERALTWTKDKGYTHERIDDGEANPTKNRTPILVPDGIFGVKEITELFSKKSSAIAPDIRSFVLEKLRGYSG